MNISRLLKLLETNNRPPLPLPRQRCVVQAGPGQIRYQASDYRAVLRARTPTPRPWRTRKCLCMTFFSTRYKCIINLIGGNAKGRPDDFSVDRLKI